LKFNAFFIPLLALLFMSQVHASDEKPSFKEKAIEDFNEIINDLKHNYVYLDKKNIDLSCIKRVYSKKLESVKTRNEKVMLFEYLLNEFYDSHVHLNTNTRESFRLSSPIYSEFKKNQAIISSVWISQIETIEENILGATITKFNEQPLDQAIEEFPVECADKDNPAVREWIANKILAGRYNQPRKLELKLVNNKSIALDLDTISLRANDSLLSAKEIDGYGVIRINNSLGNNHLIAEFDRALDGLMDTKGLILDLRNTVDGGNSYVARGIMGRFIGQKLAYQNHRVVESYVQDLPIERSWIEYVSPRGQHYTKPLVILAGRWTGSMGEGMTIGFDGMNRARVVGTEMERLAGAIEGFSFKHSTFGYMLSTEKLFHVNGTAREEFVPEHYVAQNQVATDQMMDTAIELLGEHNLSK
jgi:carboxyl-terminal processing protease